MTQFESIEEILNYAISLEQTAVRLYTDLAEKTGRPAIRDAFLGFAEEERGHERRLQGVKTGQRNLPTNSDIQDLKISELHADVALSPSSTYQDILLFAMKQEKHAFVLYTELAARTADPETRALFEQLAQEEAKHKLRFEIEYDEQILKEN